MPFAISPGVNVSEIDLTTVVPAVATTEGAIAGVFRWGPVDERVLISSEPELVSRFGRPTNYNAETFFTAASFLAYGNKLYVVRAADANTLNAVANTGEVVSPATFKIENEDAYTVKLENGDFADDNDVLFIAKYPGSIGSSLKVSVCDSATAFGTSTGLVVDSTIENSTSLTALSIAVGSNTATVKLANSASGLLTNANTAATGLAAKLIVGDFVEVGNNSIGKQYLKVTAVSAVSTNSTHASFTISFNNKYILSTDFTSQTLARRWEFYNSVGGAPAQSDFQAQFGNTAAMDEMHVVITDKDGAFSGTPGTILEVFENLSRASNAKTADGATNYYRDVINLNSQYVWVANDRVGAEAAPAATLTSSTNEQPLALAFQGGTDGGDETTVSFADIASAYDLFGASEDVDISLVLTGKSRGGSMGEQLGNYLIDNVAEKRKDCVAFVSPSRSQVVSNAGDEALDVVAFRNMVRPSSYAVLDSGYKYMYDKYNDINRYVPLNGDIAGLCVRTDSTRDPWWSPAGFNRGQIKNVIKLAYNPSTMADRDLLYKNGVNPVVTFPGQGTLLYGDKTLLARPSAFDRINVRRLFIVLEKAIAVAAKSTLFEFNDDFTRAQFRNLVEPFLRDVQGRRGIYDFRVVCDTTNNTGEVIDRNEFIGDIYIKPAKSINFIQLNFVAVRTGVEFTEVVGQF